MDVHKHLETRRAAAAALSEDCTAASAGEFGDCAFVYYRFRHNLSSAGFAWQTRPNDPDVSLVFGAAQRRFARLVVNTTEGAADAATTGIGLASFVSCQVMKHLAARRLAEVLPEHSVDRIPFRIVQPPGRSCRKGPCLDRRGRRRIPEEIRLRALLPELKERNARSPNSAS